ncbi:MAG: SdpI family protein [Hyphomonas sp.]
MKSHIRIGLAWSVLMIALMVGIVLYAGTQMPNGGEVGVHFGADGSADRYGSRQEAMTVLWLVPAIAAIISAILASAPFLDPRKENLVVGRRAYIATWISVVTLMAALTAGIAFSMIRSLNPDWHGPELVRYIIAAVALQFVLIGNYLPKTRSSFIFGVRTPWTLSSDMAWEKTHRLAGPLFIIAGCLGFIGAFVFNGLWLALQMTVLVLTAVLISVIYSYFAWRSAPDREHGTNLTV